MLAPWFISEVSVCGDKPFVRMPNNGKYERIPCQDLIFVAVVQGSTFCEASSEPDFIQIDSLIPIKAYVQIFSAFATNAVFYRFTTKSDIFQRFGTKSDIN